MPTRRALETVKGAEERMKNAEERLRSFIERPDRQYSSEEKAENGRLLDVLRIAMVEHSEAFEQAVRSQIHVPQAISSAQTIFLMWQKNYPVSQKPLEKECPVGAVPCPSGKYVWKCERC
jgi:hypothetical protein